MSVIPTGTPTPKKESKVKSFFKKIGKGILNFGKSLFGGAVA